MTSLNNQREKCYKILHLFTWNLANSSLCKYATHIMLPLQLQPRLLQVLQRTCPLMRLAHVVHYNKFAIWINFYLERNENHPKKYFWNKFLVSLLKTITVQTRLNGIFGDEKFSLEMQKLFEQPKSHSNDMK